MADYTATARTNYFHVRNEDAFRAELTRHGITVHDWDGYGGLVLEHDPEGRVAVFSQDDHGTWPYLSDDQIIGELAAGIACNRYDPVDELDDSKGLCQWCELSVVQHTSSAPYFPSLVELVSAHLTREDVAVFMESGAEKMRYVGGAAVAVNADGRTEVVDLDDIYEKARSLGSNVTTATY